MTTTTARTQRHAAQTQAHAPHVHVVPHRHTPEIHRRQRAVAFQSLAERLHSFIGNAIPCTRAVPSERARREHHLGPVLWHNTIHRPSPKHLHRCTHYGPCIIQFKSQCKNENGQYIEDLPVGVGYRPGEGVFNGVTATVMCLPLPRVPKRGQGVVGWLLVVLLYYFGCCRFKRPPPLCRRSGKGSLPHNC